MTNIHAVLWIECNLVSTSRTSTEAHSRNLPRSTNLGSASDSLPVKGRNWQTLVMNANSIAGKAAEFACLVDYTVQSQM